MLALSISAMAGQIVKCWSLQRLQVFLFFCCCFFFCGDRNTGTTLNLFQFIWKRCRLMMEITTNTTTYYQLYVTQWNRDGLPHLKKPTTEKIPTWLQTHKSTEECRSGGWGRGGVGIEGGQRGEGQGKRIYILGGRGGMNNEGCSFYATQRAADLTGWRQLCHIYQDDRRESQVAVLSSSSYWRRWVKW